MTHIKSYGMSDDRETIIFLMMYFRLGLRSLKLTHIRGVGTPIVGQYHHSRLEIGATLHKQ